MNSYERIYSLLTETEGETKPEETPSAFDNRMRKMMQVQAKLQAKGKGPTRRYAILKRLGLVGTQSDIEGTHKPSRKYIPQ